MTYAGDAHLTAAQMNTYVRDNLLNLEDNGRVRAQLATQTIPHNSWTDVLWNDESYDTNNQHSTAVNPERFITVAGKVALHYMATMVGFAAASAGERGVRVVDNTGAVLSAALHNAASTNITYVNVVCIDRIATSGWWKVQAYQSSGGNLNILTGAPCRVTFGQLGGG